MTRWLRALCAVVAMLALAACATASPPCDAHEPVPWRAVAPGVWVWEPASPADIAPSNQGHVAATSVLIDAGEALVVDPGPSLRHGQRVRASLACRFGARVRWVVNTHAHAEHVLGNAAFADPQASGQLDILATPGTLAGMRQRCVQCLDHLTHAAGDQALAGTTIVLPNRTVADGDVLTVGLAAGAPRARAGQTVAITIHGVGRLHVQHVAHHGTAARFVAQGPAGQGCCAHHHDHRRKSGPKALGQHQCCDAAQAHASAEQVKVLHARAGRQVGQGYPQARKGWQLGGQDQQCGGLGEPAEHGRGDEVEQPAETHQPQQQLQRPREQCHPCGQCHPLCAAGFGQAGERGADEQAGQRCRAHAQPRR